MANNRVIWQRLKGLFIVLLSLYLGFKAGSYYDQWKSYEYHKTFPSTLSMKSLFTYTDVSISDEHFSCEGERLQTVGEVMASIFSHNQSYERNKVEYGCYGDECILSVTDCSPFKSSECGSRILRLSITPDGKALTDSFSCIDMP